MKQKFKDGQKVWLKAKVIRKTVIGYIVVANGGAVQGYIQTRDIKMRRT